MTAPLVTRELTKKYGGLRALAQVNMEVPEGGVYALIGPNGAGKTTLIKILMNLLQATSGKAEVLGADSRSVRGKSFEQIGYVSENQDLPEWMKVGEQLRYLRDFYPTWDLELEASLLKQFDLPAHRKVKQLSRGMKMKLALTGALAFHPKLIVLDEPFGGLDPLVRDQLIEGLVERISDSTLLISSHDLAEVESFATHIGYLEQGQLRISEELSSVTGRFREVEITRATADPIPAGLPASWRRVKSSGVVVRFVESNFDEAETSAEIRQAFGEVRGVEYRPMNLRSIFLAMARGAEQG